MTVLTLAGLRVLLVEDEVMVALMLEDHLERLGCVVVATAGSVSAGLAAVERQGPTLDAALLDVNLGGEKVYPVAERLAARGIPFLFSTAYDPGSIVADFAERPVLSKPYGPRALEEMLIFTLGKAARR